MDRRGFLGAAVVAPVAAPEAIKEVVKESSKIKAPLPMADAAAKITKSTDWIDAAGIPSEYHFDVRYLTKRLNKARAAKERKQLEELLGYSRPKRYLRYLKSVSESYKDRETDCDTEMRLAIDDILKMEPQYRKILIQALKVQGYITSD